MSGMSCHHGSQGWNSGYQACGASISTCWAILRTPSHYIWVLDNLLQWKEDFSLTWHAESAFPNSLVRIPSNSSSPSILLFTFWKASCCELMSNKRCNICQQLGILHIHRKRNWLKQGLGAISRLPWTEWWVYKKIKREGLCSMDVWWGMGEGNGQWAHAKASLPPERPASRWYSIESIQGMGRGVK